MKISNLEELLVDEMRDVYHAEKQLVKALPKMAKATSSDDLRIAFTEHLEETQRQVERLEEAFKLLGQKAKGKTCEAMRGLVSEGSNVIEDTEASQVRDAGLIAAAQKVEHYEISAYGTLVAWARELQHNELAELLSETLQEEKAADEKLTQLAESGINVGAEAR